MTLYYLDGDHASAADVNTGTDPNLPWKTFTNLTKVGSPVVAGDTLQVKKTAVPYDVGASNDFEVPAIVPRNNGTAGNPITITRWGTDRPVAQISSGIQAALGVSIGKSYITWEWFEVAMTGVVAKAFALMDCSNCVLSHCFVDANDFSTTDNHEPYRIEGTTDCLVTDCIGQNCRAGASSPYTNSSAFKCYQNTRLIIEHCRAENCDTGIHDKQQGSTDNIFRYNFIKNCHWAHDTIQVPWTSPQIYECIFTNGQFRYDTNGTHSVDALHSNCVWYISPAILDPFVCRGTTPTTGLSFYNNIMYNIGQRKIRHELTVDMTIHDFNCFYNELSAQRYGTSYSSLAAWQSATGLDGNSIITDPLFVDPANDDFHLQAASPCRGIGKNGQDMGAYPRNDSTVIGPRADVPSSSVPLVGILAG